MAIYRGPGGSGDATTDASNEATIATTKAAEAAASASSAASSATNASNSASAAATSASNAATSASNASTSASSASAAQTAAETAETNAETAEVNAEAAQSLAEDWATYTTGLVNSTDYSSKAWSIGGTGVTDTASRGAAKEWATKAEDSTVDGSEYSAKHYSAKASASATSASSSASAAASSASSASGSATAASSAQTAAESARDATLAAYDNFDDRYLGPKASDPTTDNDGNALVGGTLYFNTTDQTMRLYDGSIWTSAYVTGTGLLVATNNLSDLNNATTARQNLGVEIGVDVQAYSSILANTTASYTTAEQSKLSGIEANADVTDTTNVTAAGALMDSEVTNLAQVKAFDSADYATAAQGLLANSATQPGDNVSTLTNDAGYLTSFTETNDLTAAVTWANVPDANITQSSVTQHQAALSITESQISDLGTYVEKTASTGSAALPAGTDVQRDGSPAAGYLRFNTTSTSFEGYDGSAWGAIGGGGGASAGGAIYENSDDITSNYTLTSGKNGMSVGPMTIASGVTVTIPSGQRWVIL